VKKSRRDVVSRLKIEEKISATRDVTRSCTKPLHLPSPPRRLLKGLIHFQSTPECATSWLPAARTSSPRTLAVGRERLEQRNYEPVKERPFLLARGLCLPRPHPWDPTTCEFACPFPSILSEVARSVLGCHRRLALDAAFEAFDLTRARDSVRKNISSHEASRSSWASPAKIDRQSGSQAISNQPSHRRCTPCREGDGHVAQGLRHAPRDGKILAFDSEPKRAKRRGSAYPRPRWPAVHPPSSPATCLRGNPGWRRMPPPSPLPWHVPLHIPIYSDDETTQPSHTHQA
jgi:hypothetical protein